VNLIRSHELNEAQRRAADCAAALREVYDPQPASSTCTGACNQGRLCDCVPPRHGTECCADTGDELRRPPMTKAEGRLVLAIFAASAAAVFTALWQAFFC
jgi:hypothetical protein